MKSRCPNCGMLLSVVEEISDVIEGAEELVDLAQSSPEDEKIAMAGANLTRAIARYRFWKYAMEGDNNDTKILAN